MTGTPPAPVGQQGPPARSAAFDRGGHSASRAGPLLLTTGTASAERGTPKGNSEPVKMHRTVQPTNRFHPDAIIRTEWTSCAGPSGRLHRNAQPDHAI